MGFDAVHLGKIPIPLLSAVAVLCCADSGDAALTVFTNRLAWETAITSSATETFALTPLGPSVTGANDYGFFTATLDGNSSGFTGIVEPGSVNGSREFQARISTNIPNDPSLIEVALVGPMLGIAADFVGTTDGDSLVLTIGSDTVEFDQHLSGNGDGFLGLISTSMFTMLSLTTENPTVIGEEFALDNVSFGPLPPADFDSDGDVDGMDLAKWDLGFGTPTGATRNDGDADNDMDVDGNDFLLWQQQFGFGVPGPLTGIAAVPEPATVTLVASAILAILQRHRCRANL